MSGKGGVGKTNITLNTALALTRLGERVLVIDGDHLPVQGLGPGSR